MVLSTQCLQSMQTIPAGGEVDSMLLSGKMLLVGLHMSPEEGHVKSWNIDTGQEDILPGHHRVSLLALPSATSTVRNHAGSSACLHVASIMYSFLSWQSS